MGKTSYRDHSYVWLVCVGRFGPFSGKEGLDALQSVGVDSDQHLQILTWYLTRVALFCISCREIDVKEKEKIW